MLAEIIVSAFLVFGGVFGLVGSLGLIKLNDTMQRLHAPTKTATLGVGGVLVASALHSWLVLGHVSFHEILVSVFLVLTAPISALFLSQTHILTRLHKSDLPETGRTYGWSIYEDPPAQDPSAPDQSNA